MVMAAGNSWGSISDHTKQQRLRWRRGLTLNPLRTIHQPTRPCMPPMRKRSPRRRPSAAFTIPRYAK